MRSNLAGTSAALRCGAKADGAATSRIGVRRSSPEAVCLPVWIAPRGAAVACSQPSRFGRLRAPCATPSGPGPKLSKRSCSRSSSRNGAGSEQPSPGFCSTCFRRSSSSPSSCAACCTTCGCFAIPRWASRSSPLETSPSGARARRRSSRNSRANYRIRGARWQSRHPTPWAGCPLWPA